MPSPSPSSPRRTTPLTTRGKTTSQPEQQQQQNRNKSSTNKALVRPKLVGRQKTWAAGGGPGGTTEDFSYNNNNNNNVSGSVVNYNHNLNSSSSNNNKTTGSGGPQPAVQQSISIAKTINQLLHIPSNRQCADCRSALVDSSQVHASFRPPILTTQQQQLLSTRPGTGLALSRSNLAQTRFFAKAHRSMAPPFLSSQKELIRNRSSGGSMNLFKKSSIQDINDKNNNNNNGFVNNDNQGTSNSGSSSRSRSTRDLVNNNNNGASQEITAHNPYTAIEGGGGTTGGSSSNMSGGSSSKVQKDNNNNKEPPNGSFLQHSSSSRRQQQQQQQKGGKERENNSIIIDPAIVAIQNVWGHGVFLCGQCAQAHQLLGETVTVVRHVQEYQTWTGEEAMVMKQAGGNTMGWMIYEAHLPDHWRRKRPNHASPMSERLTFCRAKYEALGFILPQISGGPWCDQAWKRLMKHNTWAKVNPGPARELGNLVALTLERNNSLNQQQQQLNNSINNNNSMNGMNMAPAPLPELPTRLIDYFCVVGSSGFLDPRILQGEVVDLSILEGPEDINLEPRVIDCYPPPAEHTDMEFPEHVATFVLPEGCRPSESQKSPFFFTFVLTSATGHRLYGGSLRLYDEAIETHELRDIIKGSEYDGAYPPWLPPQTTPPTTAAAARGDGQHSVDSSEYMDIVYLPKCLVVLSHYPLFDLFRNFLLQLYRITLVQAPLPIERFIANFVKEVPLPPQGKVEVKFGFTVKDIWSVQRPPENELPLTNFSFKPLFACLSVGNILTVVGCLLTESRVALCSRHYALLTPIAEALLSFLFPFEWQAFYLPVMPYSMLDILDAPVPFLLGLHARYLIETHPQMRPQGVVFVDLDRDIVHLGYDEDTNNPRMVPALPEKMALKLRAKVEEHCSSLYLSPDNAKHEGNSITTAQGKVLSDYKREAYAATFQPTSSLISNDRATSSLPGADEMRRAEPRRRPMLRSVDKAYQENELLTPITGFLSEQGQLYNREPMRNLRTQKSGGGMGKMFKIRRLRSQNSLYEEEHQSTQSNSGHFIQTEISNLNRGLHGLLLDMEEPVGFDSDEIRNAFLRFFVSLLKNYEQFLNNDNPDDPFRLEEFLTDLYLTAPSTEFVKKMLKTQMFQRFLEERQNDPRDPVFRFFDECIIAKQNRSKKLYVRTTNRDTPFLDDTSGAIKETFTPPPPSNWGLPDDGRSYQYGSFPKLNHELFGKIRQPIKWQQMKRRRSSLRMLQSSDSSMKGTAWQHEILARSLAPTGGFGSLSWAAKTGIQTLEAALGALSQSAPKDQTSFFNISNSSFPSWRQQQPEHSSRGKGLPARTREFHRPSFLRDISVTTITKSEHLVLNALRFKGILLGTLIKLQALGRCFLMRRRYQRFVKAVRFLQYKWKRQVPEGLTEKNELKKARISVLIIQREVRAFLFTRSNRRKEVSIGMLQRWYRGAVCRKRIRRLVRACKRIQSLVRSRLARLAFRLLRNLVANVQARWRGFLTRERIMLRNERLMSKYREQIVLLWSRLHAPLSYRTKFWPIIAEKSSFLRLRIAESELQRLWIGLEVDFSPETIMDRIIHRNHVEELRLGRQLGINNDTLWKCLKVQEMSSNVLLFPAEERRNPELRLAADRVEAERIQIYERISANTPQIAAMLVTLYDLFNIDKGNRSKKFRLTEVVWSDVANAKQSETMMMQVFPELDDASNIVFIPPSKKALGRFRNVDPSPPRLDKSMWAHSILSDRISKNVLEVAVNALQGPRLGVAFTKSALDHYVAHIHRGTPQARRNSIGTIRRDLLCELLVNRKWEGK